MSPGGAVSLRVPSLAGQPCVERGPGLLRSLAWELGVLAAWAGTRLMGSSREWLRVWES